MEEKCARLGLPVQHMRLLLMFIDFCRVARFVYLLDFVSKTHEAWFHRVRTSTDFIVHELRFAKVSR